MKGILKARTVRGLKQKDAKVTKNGKECFFDRNGIEFLF
jgi:hypothetical protein